MRAVSQASQEQQRGSGAAPIHVVQSDAVDRDEPVLRARQIGLNTACLGEYESGHDHRNRHHVSSSVESVARRHFRTVSLVSKVSETRPGTTIHALAQLQSGRLFGHILAIRYGK
jgi:hypothetical protein